MKKAQAEISIYPLRTDFVSAAIDEFCAVLKDNGLEVDTRAMGSFVAGDMDVLFESTQAAFGKLAEKYDVVMDFKISNACPGHIAR